MSSGRLPETGEHSSPYYLQMQVKALSRKEEAIYEHDSERLMFSLGLSSFKTD